MTVDHLYIDRQDQTLLRDTLAGIPTLVEDLAITIAKQDRLVRPGTTSYRKRRRMDGSTPVKDAAFDDHLELHNTLTTWVRLTCEEQHIDEWPANNLLSLAAWLRANLTALARCEGAREATDDIVNRVETCRRHIDLPPEDMVVAAEHAKVVADRTMVTLSTIDAVCGKIADAPPGLNERRLRHLTSRGRVKPVSVDRGSRTKFYRLSDVIEAHHAHPARQRSAG